VSQDVIEDALAESRRRGSISDRDVSAEIDHFDAVVRSVCDDWGLTAEHWFDGGVGPPPLAVTSEDGTPAVLKICSPGAADAAVRVMSAAEGDGYVRVLSWDAVRGALLTERLGRDLWSVESSLGAQARVVLPLLRDAWQVPLSRGAPFEGKAAGLARILARLGPRYGAAHPEALELASGYVAELAATELPEVVCHGDPHPGNVLRRGNDWALIDPDGFVGERAYDLGVVLRDACREIRAAEASETGAGAEVLRAACRLAGELAGVDPGRVWRWAFVERVTTGLYLRWFGHPEESATFLGTATSLVRARPQR
jgi:streptomycin 6-kinase